MYSKWTEKLTELYKRENLSTPLEVNVKEVTQVSVTELREIMDRDGLIGKSSQLNKLSPRVERELLKIAIHRCVRIPNSQQSRTHICSLYSPFQEGTFIVVIPSPLPFNIKGWEHIPPL